MSQQTDHSELVNKILTGARWATALRLGAQILSWVSTIIVVRFISPEDYGLNSMLTSPLILMMLLSTLGLEAALVQAKTIQREELQSTFGWLLIVNGVLFVSYFFGGALLASYFNEPRLETLAKVLAFIFLLVPFRVIPNALLDRDLDFKLRAQLEITASLVAALTTVLMAYFGAGVWALIIGVVVNKTLLAVLLMIFKPWFIMPTLHFTTTKRMMVVGGIITLSGFLALISDQLITLIAGPTLGATVLGIYGMSAELASLPLSKFMPVINQTMLPAFARFQEDRIAATHYFEKLLGVTSLAFIPMMVGMACVADTLVLTVFGDKWSASILPLIIMSLGMAFRMLALQLKTVVTSMGRADLSLKSHFLQLLILLPLTVYAMAYGVIGLILAWVLTEFLVMIATVQMCKSILDVTFLGLLRCYRPALMSSGLMAILVFSSKIMLGNSYQVTGLLIELSVGTVSYYLATRFIFNKQFLIAFKTIFGKRFAFLSGQTG